MNKLSLFLTITLFSLIKDTNAQSFTTQSKSCGKCHKPVSISSTVGMRCPHCGVRWGSQNTTRTSSTVSRYDNDFDTEITSGMTNSKVNLRSTPSTKSRIINVIPAYTFLKINWRTGDWYYVTYSEYNGLFTEEKSGYVHRTLIN